MIVPSIDLMGGQAVQLIGGEKKAIDAGDPIPIAEKFKLAGEIAVIDLDAAMGTGSNEELIKKLIRVAPCRVGGGIRDVDTAVKWLNAGAKKVILGTKAVPEILSQLPKDRVLAALDSKNDEIVVQGWKVGTGKSVISQIRELHDYVAGFLITFVELEGRLGGTDLERVKQYASLTVGKELTIAGGITTVEEIAMLDDLGADAQVGMALYANKLELADAIAAPVRTDRTDGLVPTVVCDEQGVALGLCYSNRESLRKAVELKRGAYWSRSRNELWIKGEKSGATQELLAIDVDCDRDTLRFTVRQSGKGFCHKETRTCWGKEVGIGKLARLIKSRIKSAPANSYTRKLLADPALLKAKLLEEAAELTEAKTKPEIIHETADVFYFALVAMTKGNVSLSDIEEEFERRSLQLIRRGGNAK